MCADKKMITLEKVRDALLNMRCEVKVPDEVSKKARKAIERMLAVG